MTELAAQLDMDRGTMRRFLATLLDLGYITCSPTSKTFSISLKVLELGYSAVSGLEWREIAQQHLHGLFVELHQIVSMCILVETDVQYLVRYEPPSVQFFGIGIGTRRPAYASSMGKMLFAVLPEEQRRKLAEKCPFQALTPYTVKNSAELLRQLETVRQNGYAISDREVTPFSRSVSVPISCQDRVVAAAAVAVQVERFSVDELVKQILPRLQACTDAISRALECVEYRV